MGVLLLLKFAKLPPEAKKNNAVVWLRMILCCGPAVFSGRRTAIKLKMGGPIGEIGFSGFIAAGLKSKGYFFGGERP